MTGRGELGFLGDSGWLVRRARRWELEPEGLGPLTSCVALGSFPCPSLFSVKRDRGSWAIDCDKVEVVSKAFNSSWHMVMSVIKLKLFGGEGGLF